MSTLASLLVSPFRMTSAQAVVRGLQGKCPNCGSGRMFSRFLKVADRCPACREELFHQRADDFPAYLVILLVGHTVVPLALLVETEYSPVMWLQVAFWLPLTIGLALGLIQPIKGAIVAIQWYGGMHGFGQFRLDGAPSDRAAPAVGLRPGDIDQANNGLTRLPRANPIDRRERLRDARPPLIDICRA